MDQAALGADEEGCDPDDPRGVAGDRRSIGAARRAPSGIARGLQVHARAGPRVRRRDAHRRAPARDPPSDRRNAERRRRPVPREPVAPRPSCACGRRLGARRALLHLGRSGGARVPGGGGGAAHRRPGAAGRVGRAGPRRAAHLPGRRARTCCVARPTGSRASPSWPRWPRRWATPTSSSSVKLRRAAALRVSEEEDQAAELAMSVREAAPRARRP